MVSGVVEDSTGAAGVVSGVGFAAGSWAFKLAVARAAAVKMDR
jgi:hypothetical protein